MNFGLALEALKNGNRVARAGWNGKDMWLILVPGTEDVKPTKGSAYDIPAITEYHANGIEILSHIDMYTAGGAMLPGWLASQTDMLADDWEILE